MRTHGMLRSSWVWAVSIMACAAFVVSAIPVGATLSEDESITAQVKSTLASDPSLGKRQIVVNTYNKRVQLTGFVGNQKESAKAVELARSLDEVKSVQDNLMIEEGPGPHIIPRLNNWQSALP